MSTKQNGRYIKVPLHKLKAHPRNAELYQERTRREIEELAADMEKNGQLEAVEVVPDYDDDYFYLIVSGHGRWQAGKLLGWKTIRCWVRHDLAEAGEVAVEMRLVEANLRRRHLSRLDIARSFQALKKLARDNKGRLPAPEKAKGDLRDLLAKRYGLSGKTLERLVKVLGLPLVLQRAVEEGWLALVEAVKLAGLPRKTIDVIADEVAGVLANGADDAKARKQKVKAILAPHKEKLPKRVPEVKTLLRQGLSGLKQFKEGLANRFEEISTISYDAYLADLSACMAFLTDLTSHLQLLRRKARKNREKLDRLMKEGGWGEEE